MKLFFLNTVTYNNMLVIGNYKMIKIMDPMLTTSGLQIMLHYPIKHV